MTGMEVTVTRMQLDSDAEGLQVTVTIRRHPAYQYHDVGELPQVSDLPRDMRQALREWLDAPIAPD